jgi:thiol-disulfide isomerase/thioredoxin
MDWGPRRRAALVVITLLLASSAPAIVAGQATEGEDLYAQRLDVRVVPASCVTSENCTITQPTHLVEYFSADWCEPCEQVTQQLENISDETVVVLQHHPSPSDVSFLSTSKERFDQTYRLLFLPSLVVDGTYLLTGTRQAMDLPTVLNNSSLPTSALDSLRVENGTMTWQAPNSTVLRVWYAEPTPHETNGKIHDSLARSMVEVNASAGTMNLSTLPSNPSGVFVVVLEQPGTAALTVASLAPTGLMDLSDVTTDQTGLRDGFGQAGWVMVATLGLMLLLSPALVMHRGLMKNSEHERHAGSSAEE